MKQATCDVLHTLNLRFYDAHAEHFDRTRERPWRGSARVFEHVASTAPSVLDLGCGNGRLLALLGERYPDGLAYTGVDASARLLSMAGERFAALAPQLLRMDFLGDDPAHELPAATFDAVVLFGVMHHVPREANRRALLAAAAARVAAGGILAFTVWRFDLDARLARRSVVRNACAGRDPALHDPALQAALCDLDPGDDVLRWGDGGDAMRYCHAADDAEVERWLEGLDLVTLERFRADGSGERMNDYLVLRRPHAPTPRPA